MTFCCTATRRTVLYMSLYYGCAPLTRMLAMA